jgi:very-short-patch-repair endonuclease
MPGDSGFQFGGKPTVLRPTFHIRPAAGRVGGKPRAGVEIFHVLPTPGRSDGASAATSAATSAAIAAAIAADQRGLIHHWQLGQAGFSTSAINRLMARGVLHRILPRVYVIGHLAAAPGARELAVLLYLDGDAVLSHLSAARIWRICSADDGAVHATVIGRDVRRRSGLRTYRVGALHAGDVALHHGLPVTSVARTILDVAGCGADADLHEALVEAWVKRLVSDAALEAAIERAPLRTGIARLRALMRAERGPALTRSQAERLLCALLDQGWLPRPQFNVKLHGYLVDALWPAERLVIEADGFATHGHRAAFERDRLRDQTMAAHGFTTVRITWRQLRDEPMAVLARISMALAYARARAG